METLRTPLFVLALVLSGLIVGIDIGATALPKAPPATTAGVAAQVPPGPIRDALAGLGQGEIEQLSNGSETPPGIGIPYMALVDGVTFFTVALMGVGLLIRERLQARLQGCATAIFSLLLILGALGLIFLALGALLLMVGLLLAVPFGTLTYLALFGFFPRGTAAAVLSVLMILKLGFAACLVLAQQRFLQNRGLILIVLTSLLANVIVSLLHGLVPGFLVSITDAIAAIVNGILAVIWGIVLLIGSLPAILGALNVSRV